MLSVECPGCGAVFRMDVQADDQRDISRLDQLAIVAQWHVQHQAHLEAWEARQREARQTEGEP
jgi:hypothetical protein